MTSHSLSCSVRRVRGSRCAYTLMEMLIAIAVLALITALVVPTSSGSNERVRLNAASWILASDIEFAQVMSISYPKDPVLVRFDSDKRTYWLAHSSAPNTPIERGDTGEAYIVTFGEGRTAAADGAVFELQNFPGAGNNLQFEPHGGLSSFNTTPSVILRINGTQYPRLVLTIAPTTGTVTTELQKAP